METLVCVMQIKWPIKGHIDCNSKEKRCHKTNTRDKKETN